MIKSLQELKVGLNSQILAVIKTATPENVIPELQRNIGSL